MRSNNCGQKKTTFADRVRRAAFALVMVISGVSFSSVSGAGPNEIISIIARCEFNEKIDPSLKNESIELWREFLAAVGQPNQVVYRLAFRSQTNKIYRASRVERLEHGRKYQSSNGQDSLIFKNIRHRYDGRDTADAVFELSSLPPNVDARYLMHCHDFHIR
jgi:hypothetical protein